MEISEAKRAISIPQINRLKDLGMGITMGKVFGKRVLIQPMDPYTKVEELEKKGLLYIPESAKAGVTPLPSMGTVLQLGVQLIEDFSNDYDAEEFWPLRVGDMVMFGKYSGSDIAVDKIPYKILTYEEVMCTLDVTNPEAYAVTTD